MLSLIFYSLLIFSLVYWVESQSVLISNPSILKRNAAEELEDWLKKFNWGNRQELAAPGRLPSYKFYSEVVEILLSETFANYQKIILTHELGFFREFRRKLSAGHPEWCFLRLEGNGDILTIVLRPQDRADEAVIHLLGQPLLLGKEGIGGGGHRQTLPGGL